MIASESTMARESTTAVIAAIAGNLAIAACKFVAAGISGSAAMLSEAIHSLVDAGNDALMLYGIKRSGKPPDADHPFGYGHELYFWTLVVGMLIFAVGGGMSILTGILHVVNHVSSEASLLGYGVLAVAAVFEGISWYLGLRAFRKEQGDRGVVETIQVSKDPTTFSVLLEDSAALLGLAFAFAGIFVGQRFGLPWADGASSIAIGVLLCAIALVMVYESKSLLVGEGVGRTTAQTLRALIASDPAVESIGRLATMYLGPDEVILALEIRFRSDRSLGETRAAISRMTNAIRTRYPRIRHVFIDASAIGGAA
ncbi:MAG TPA: cation diffusion facilitator family transporter [Casimicrobiaceae bacterium]|nr:cation diffusion facilitator family transporter [Casimicrobiaceae bacterium]